jgi:hypothetical protein
MSALFVLQVFIDAQVLEDKPSTHQRCTPIRDTKKSVAYRFFPFEAIGTWLKPITLAGLACRETNSGTTTTDLLLASVALGTGHGRSTPLAVRTISVRFCETTRKHRIGSPNGGSSEIDDGLPNPIAQDPTEFLPLCCSCGLSLPCPMSGI